jgi:hypothetical protein
VRAYALIWVSCSWVRKRKNTLVFTSLSAEQNLATNYWFIDFQVSLATISHGASTSYLLNKVQYVCTYIQLIHLNFCAI